MGIEWGAIGLVVVVSAAAGVAVVVLFAAGVLALAQREDAKDSTSGGSVALPTAGATLCFVASGLIVLYGLYLVVGSQLTALLGG